MTDKNPTQTIEISNFSGRLTRIINGDLNSGLAKFTQSWGYDPFSKPMNLTWFEQPVNIGSSITGVVLDARPRSTAGTTFVYAIASSGNNANLYQINPNSRVSPNLDTTSLLGAITNNNPAFDYGASMDFFGSSEKIYISSNTQINTINFDGSGDATVGSASNYKGNTYHPLKQFIGKLMFGNGNTIGAISTTGTVTSSIIGTGQGNLYSEINPPLPVESSIHDLDSSIDGNYLLITSSYNPNEAILDITSDGQAASASEGALNKWNGIDQAVTAFISIPSYAVTSLQTYLNNNMFFSNDSFGASVNDGTNKILTLTNNKPPLPNATSSNANFLTWMNTEVASDNSTIYGSLYYFGALDQENAPGLYRILRQRSTLTNGFVYQIPMNRMVNNKYATVNNSSSSVLTLGYGKHYFSTIETSAGGSVFGLYRTLVTSTGTGTPNLGVYETQTQLFSRKIAIKEIRVYTEPTVSGNGFQLDCIGGDGTVITNSANSSYAFSAGTDVTKLQGSLENVNFNPVMKATYALGIRLTNTGTTNMTIKKVEVDWQQAGI